MAESSRLRWRKLSDEVAATLRRMILVGELTPGSRVTQDALASRLGVSTMPVREALLRLAAEGFVEAAPNRSFTVVRTARSDIHDIYWMHAKLAGELTSRACAHADADLMQTLRKLSDRCQQAYEEKNAAEMEAANWAFHRAINLAADAPKLLLMLRTSLRFIPDDFYARIPGWPEASSQGHGQIVTAFEQRDPEAARAAAEAHVHQAGTFLTAYFSGTGFWTRPAGGGGHE